MDLTKLVSFLLILGLCRCAPPADVHQRAAFSFALGGSWWSSRTLGQSGNYLTERFRSEVFDKVLSKLSVKIYDLYQTNWRMTVIIWIAVALDVILVFWAAQTQCRISSRDCTASSGQNKSLHGDIDYKTGPAHAYEDVADSIKMKATR